MTSYIEITDGETDPGAPATSELAKKWRDNPIAMAEGAVGAPRVQGIALGGISMGAITVGPTTEAGYTNCDRMGLLYANFVGLLYGSYSVQVAFSSDNGASYGAWRVLFTFSLPGTARAIGNMRLNLETGDWYFAALAPDPYVYSGTVSTVSGCNAFKIRGVGGSFDFFCLGGVEA